ncbi:50S ribosomal protein L1 [Candidatus Tachikawaea gelatinosa]|uniref:Large ribosomal subunit protein uL1 n=1 Tax=Candidatus Tachikawaea gelatinosa TaxID=1410383 RepID=A0A090BWH3_9ENTR|nr:50S ribosomal protein L1 [Candidatus Tachikawaea gelatinosa]BAP58606.1 50S ribosomal protein L1 [Candidatus Tachikawaea gelatinosa]
MIKLTKRMRDIHKKVDYSVQYAIDDAISLLKDTASNRFVESVDIAVNLGIDSRKSDQNVRGSSFLPHGLGRTTRIAVFAEGNNADLAKSAGADIVGMESLSNQIKKNEIKFDVLIASPDVMSIVSGLGQILGPKGLMPNPKLGTVTNNLKETIKNIKLGQVRYRNDKNGIIHATIGKINFDINKIKENLVSLLKSLKKNKPSNSKGTFFKKITLSTTMGVGLMVDQNSLNLSKN